MQDDVWGYVCEHGTALDVHCCHCHSGFIFDLKHECPDQDRGSAERHRDKGADALLHRAEGKPPTRRYPS